MEKVKCEICGKKVTTDKAYRITRYDLAMVDLTNWLPVQVVCRDCLAARAGISYEEQER